MMKNFCGKINSEVKSSQILAPAFDASKDVVDVVDIIKPQQETTTAANNATVQLTQK